MNRKTLVYLTLFLVLLADQALKVWVKTHMSYGEEIQLLGYDRALIHFVENNGMAFGLTLGGQYGKLALTLFRIVAVSFLFVYLARLIRERAPRWLLIGFVLIQAGALGNIIDSVFYGRFFSESSFHGGVATLFPANGGYAPLLYGRVVDMFYFPLFYGTYPAWFPVVGGEAYLFFRPVFNLADVAISVGVLILLGCYFRPGQETIQRKKGAPIATGAGATELPEGAALNEGRERLLTNR
ncbi:lipoprotein signal peptidase [Neolewinella antarctica]|uniref:Lipoprotein signal peptidase n=1 Tax=Neolewinella antarctica TaxID=442734 RepID=A0ABX0XD73_9BACT|nr:lipoprotein signal peptidase [Neolewinella antarctica]NJC27225.1 signal peptidase II [Neolewinella antarctica]